ncbi:MAG TPA: hypothetical protein PLP69_02315 [Bacteroidales bacterium]|nr:hypothetical protein [Bacteroidales bacterium]
MIGGRITRCASLIRRLRLATLVILVWGNDKRKSLSLDSLVSGLCSAVECQDYSLRQPYQEAKAGYARDPGLGK